MGRNRRRGGGTGRGDGKGAGGGGSSYPLANTIQIVAGLGGQSNMMGGTTGAYATPAISTSQPFDNQKWTGSALTDLIEPYTGANNNESPASGFGNFLTDINAADARVVNTYTWAVAGASITTLRSGQTAYNNAVTEMGQLVDALPGITIRHVAVWQHGEADDNVTPTFTAAQYATEMVNFQAAWQSSMQASADATGTVPLVYGQVGQWSLYGASTAPIRTNVGQGQWAAARDNSSTIYLACPTYQLPYQSTGTNVHLTNSGELRLGEYLAKAVNYVVVNGQAWLPLHMSSATAVDNVITIQLAGGDGSNIAADTTQMIARHTRGFEYTDSSGNPASIVSVSVNAAARTVALTLNKDTAAGRTVRYGLTSPVAAICGGAPTGTPVGIGPGGNIRDSDTTASRVGGAPALQNWLVCHELAVSSASSVSPVSAPAWANANSMVLGSTDWVSVAEADETSGASAVTWAFWVRHGTAWPSSGVMLQKAITGHTCWDFRCASSGRGIFYIYTGASTTADLTTANSTFTSATWYHVVVVYDGSQGTANNRLRVYVNGSDISGSGTYTGTMPTSLRSASRCALAIGSSANDTSPFGASGGANMRDICIWNGTAATAGNVTSLYNGGTAIDPATGPLGQPTHHWRLESDFADYGSTPCHGVALRSTTFNTVHP